MANVGLRRLHCARRTRHAGRLLPTILADFSSTSALPSSTLLVGCDFCGSTWAFCRQEKPSLLEPGSFLHAERHRLTGHVMRQWLGVGSCNTHSPSSKSIVPVRDDAYQMAWIEAPSVLCTSCTAQIRPCACLAPPSCAEGGSDLSGCTSLHMPTMFFGRSASAQHGSELANRRGRRSSRGTGRPSGVSALPAVRLFGFRQLLSKATGEN